jgi:hypothetical protein
VARHIFQACPVIYTQSNITDIMNHSVHLFFPQECYVARVLLLPTWPVMGTMTTI